MSTEGSNTGSSSADKTTAAARTDIRKESKTETSLVQDAIDLVIGRTAGRSRQSTKCQQHVLQCMQYNHIVKLLVAALKSSGCKLKLSRHVSCEPCSSKVFGGYDDINKQVVICENVAKTSNAVCTTLAHEMIHAFDDCRAKVNFKNLDHLACTEIRAANLLHCSYQEALTKGYASPSGVGEQHFCVRAKARESIMAVRDVSKEEATAAVDRVFDRCYRDLEPIGRIPQNAFKDGERIYVEASLLGYTEARR